MIQKTMLRCESLGIRTCLCGCLYVVLRMHLCVRAGDVPDIILPVVYSPGPHVVKKQNNPDIFPRQGVKSELYKYCPDVHQTKCTRVSIVTQHLVHGPSAAADTTIHHSPGAPSMTPRVPVLLTRGG